MVVLALPMRRIPNSESVFTALTDRGPNRITLANTVKGKGISCGFLLRTYWFVRSRILDWLDFMVKSILLNVQEGQFDLLVCRDTSALGGHR